MNSDNKFWLFFVLIVCFSISFGFYLLNENSINKTLKVQELINSGVEPVAIRCAFSKSSTTADPICVILATKSDNGFFKKN